MPVKPIKINDSNRFLCHTVSITNEVLLNLVVVSYKDGPTDITLISIASLPLLGSSIAASKNNLPYLKEPCRLTSQHVLALSTGA